MSIIKKILILSSKNGLIYALKYYFLRTLDRIYSDYNTRNIIRKSVEIKSPLILITQIQRSGGTLLSQLFDGHPDVYAYPNELTIWEPKWELKNLENNFKAINNKYVNYFALNSEYKKESKSKWNKSYLFYFNLNAQREIFKKYSTKKNSQRNILNSYFSSFFSSWVNYKNILNQKKLVSAFIPRVNLNEKSVKYFFKNYPDGKIITIVRDPLDWLASAKIHDPKNYSNFEFALNTWKKSTISSLKLSKNPNVIPVTFFDLVSNTEKLMSSICKKLQIQKHDITLRPTFNNEPILSDSSFKSVEGKIDKKTLSRKTKSFNKRELSNLKKISKLVRECENLYKRFLKLNSIKYN